MITVQCVFPEQNTQKNLMAQFGRSRGALCSGASHLSSSFLLLIDCFSFFWSLSCFLFLSSASRFSLLCFSSGFLLKSKSGLISVVNLRGLTR